MSDDSRRKEKVAAGMKKLKDFQHRTGKIAKHINAADKMASPIMNKNPKLELFGDEDSETAIIKRAEDLSSTESLLQITQQINGLMSETDALLNVEVQSDVISGQSVSELERRNQELASLLGSQRQATEHLQFHLQELKSRLSRMQKEFEKDKVCLLEQAHKDQVALKDQLQVHIQTIGILVAEKTELQSSLNQSQQTAKQKAGEVEELQGRLRALRQRLADFERESSVKSSSISELEKAVKEFSLENDRLRVEERKLGKENEDLHQQVNELIEKLKGKTTHYESVEQELADIRGKLSLSEMYIQQLTSTSDTGNQNSKKIEELFQDNLDLEQKLKESQDTYQKISKEKELLSEQYQSYVNQLSRELETLKNKLEQVKEENYILQKEKSASIQLLEVNENHTSMSDKLSEELSELKHELHNCIEENKTLKNQYNSQVSDNTQLSSLLEERDLKVVELETELHKYYDHNIDKSQLLETMQSDKVAASRAISQNRELKKQLEELQAGFVKMSNDKLNLTEELQHEHHVNKELGERFCQQEEELREVRDQLVDREKQLQQLEKSSTKDMYQQHQIVDRMRHYEAQGQLTEMLQKELTQAQDHISALSHQNTQLRMSLAQQVETTVEFDKNSDDKDGIKKSDLVASLSASVRQLEMERDQLMRQMHGQQSQMECVKNQMLEIQVNDITGNHDSHDGVVSQAEYKTLKKAMTQLEERFRMTMEQIAELSDQKQQLEHLVTQLQGETDTIADYISLYQMQRGIMRRRADEKDEYIAKLARDREDLKSKLSELQDLVMRMLEKRKHSELVDTESVQPPIWAVSENGMNHIADDCVEESHKMIEEDLPVIHSCTKNSENTSENTAKKIMQLLSDIGTSNLVERPTFDNFHPCPVCSGRLLTI